MSPDVNAAVAIFAPATVSNVGPGFDCFGFALESPGDIVRARIVDAPGITIASIDGEGAAALPRDPQANTAAIAAASIWRRCRDAGGRGLELRLEKGLPGGSGLGSSAASAVAGAAAAAALAARCDGEPVAGQAILEAALDGEAAASGQRHADNVAPALLGGFTIVQSIDPLYVARIEPKLACHVALVRPHIAISTREARALLSRQVDLCDAVANWSNAAALVAALLTGDLDLARRALVDRVVEPQRAPLIPGFAAVRTAALEAGAFGCSISGAGPTIFALAESPALAATAAEAMGDAFARCGAQSTRHVSTISLTGARPA